MLVQAKFDLTDQMELLEEKRSREVTNLITYTIKQFNPPENCINTMIQMTGSVVDKAKLINQTKTKTVLN